MVILDSYITPPSRHVSTCTMMAFNHAQSREMHTMLTDEQIEAAKKTTRYSTTERPLHEHNDCIRFAYEWLDAQVKTKGQVRTAFQIKHLIERWAGRYVSTSDVDVAAHLHPDVRGQYPYYNISSRLTNPSKDRISHLGQAFSQDQNDRHDLKNYSRSE